MNYYEILEVSPNASAEVIRAAYKSLMQRYHPDKHPGDTAIAERASLVVQVYEVLSDADKRAAYDLKLKSAPDSRPASARPPAHRRHAATRQAEKDGKGFWYLCLLIVVIVGSGWAITSQLKKRLAPEESSTLVGKDVAGRAKGAASREIPVLVAGLAVNLKKPDNPDENSGRVLHIPSLGVRVGALDAENAVRHLNNTRDLVSQKLLERLSAAKYEELIKVDGEQYLARIILDAISEATGTRPAGVAVSDPESPARYGVVEVLLPHSYSVK